ncbi:MAG: polymerase sigma factor RpoE [Myxococcaceae bacterium]|nr:polymerase sigma factor RpoE [Myxococcaceae bacterium]
MHREASAIVREHGTFVWRVLRHLGVAEASLHDASQEVFIVVFQKLEQFEHRSSVRTWLYGICRHVALAARRKARARPEVLADELPELGVAPTQEGEVWAQQARALLSRALSELGEDQRMVFVLFEIEELSMEEVAQSLGLPLTTAYSRLYAAREKVQASMRRYERLGLHARAMEPDQKSGKELLE